MSGTQKIVSNFVRKHFVSATNVSQFAQPKKHHGQQCVHNAVSSFTSALNSTKNLLRYFTVPKLFYEGNAGKQIFRKDRIPFDSIRLTKKEGLKLKLILASHTLFKKFHFNNQNWNKTYFIAV